MTGSYNEGEMGKLGSLCVFHTQREYERVFSITDLAVIDAVFAADSALIYVLTNDDPTLCKYASHVLFPAQVGTATARIRLHHVPPLTATHARTRSRRPSQADPCITNRDQ